MKTTKQTGNAKVANNKNKLSMKKKECGPQISKLEAVHKDEPPFGCFKHSVLHQAKFLNSKVYR